MLLDAGGYSILKFHNPTDIHMMVNIFRNCSQIISLCALKTCDRLKSERESQRISIWIDI